MEKKGEKETTRTLYFKEKKKGQDMELHWNGRREEWSQGAAEGKSNYGGGGGIAPSSASVFLPVTNVKFAKSC